MPVYLNDSDDDIDSAATVDDALAQIDKKNHLIPYWSDPRREVKVGVVVDPEARTIKEWKAGSVE